MDKKKPVESPKLKSPKVSIEDPPTIIDSPVQTPTDVKIPSEQSKESLKNGTEEKIPVEGDEKKNSTGKGKENPVEKGKEGEKEKPPEEEKEEDESEFEPSVPQIPLYHDWESQKATIDRANVMKEKKVEKERDKWNNSVEFVLSSISSAVGLGNIWRFSRTALENGGGAFLIPYLILVIIVARPLYYLEAAVGQFSSRGCAGIWDMVPIFRGVGYAMAFLSAITVTYYVAILAFCGAYVIFGFADPLPWKDCNEKNYVSRDFLTDNSFKCYYNVSQKRYMAHFASSANNKTVEKVNAEMYFQYRVAQQLENIDDGIGTPLGHLAGPLLFMWILIFFSLVFGAKSSGKTAYFTAIFPYIVLIIILIVACCLDGAASGISYFFTPDWEKILKIDVWVNALNQCLFSLGIGYGQVIAYGSFNGFRQKISRDAFIVSSMDTFTSLLAGITVFSSLGVLAHVKGIHVSTVANGGFSLLFVSYAELFLSFGPTPLPQIFSFLFFFMLLVLGVGSAAGYFHTVVTTILDSTPRLAGKKRNKIILTGCLCIVFFLLAIPMTTPGGIFVITLLDQYSGAFICYAVVLFEMIGIAWIYGMKSFMIDICFMTNSNINSVCSIAMMMWGYAVPVLLIGVVVFVITDMKEPVEKVNGVDTKFPLPVLCIGALLPILLALMIPGMAIYVFFSRKTGTCYKKYMASKSPNNKWGPKDAQERQNWIDYKRDLDDRCWLYKQTISRCCPEREEIGSMSFKRQRDTSNIDEQLAQTDKKKESL